MGQVDLRVLGFSSVSIIPPKFHAHRQLTAFYTCQKNTLTYPGIPQTKHSCFGYAGTLDRKFFHIMFVVCQLRAKAVERTE